MHPYSSVMTNCAPTTITEKNIEDFNAEKFVEVLLNEGATAPCDETVKTFYENEVVPPFYDEDMYKRFRAALTLISCYISIDTLLQNLESP